MQPAAQPWPAGKTRDVSRELTEQSRAVTDAFRRSAETIEHRHPKIIQRRVLRIANVATGLDRVAAATRENERDVFVRVPVGIRDGTAESDHGVVEHCALPFFH